MPLLVNLACGNSYINNPDWINLDFNSNSKNVFKANLITNIPLKTNSADFVYSSHFIEHLDCEDLNQLLDEIFRILKPGGILRISTPNYEYLVKEYISLIKEKELNDEIKTKIKFVKLLIIDQIFRTKSGGNLKKFYLSLNENLSDYCKEIGGDFKKAAKKKNRRLLSNLKRITLTKIFYKLRITLALLIAPKFFKNKNISMSQPGEMHRWIYDYFELKDILIEKGFLNIYKFKAGQTKSIFKSDIKRLELLNSKLDRKGKSNLIVECTKLI
tara:strand:- start:49 stop:864 length:816 start_codon:yes stop_codon:yes gene_type:complete